MLPQHTVMRVKSATARAKMAAVKSTGLQGADYL